MTPTMRSVLVTIAVAFAAGLAGVGVGKLIFAPSQPNMHQLVHRDLHLTAAQTARIEGLEADFAQRRQALELEMRAANLELAAAIREERGYGPHVGAAVGRFHAAMGQLQDESIRHVFAMRATLAPGQTSRFDNIVASALTAEPH